MVNGTFIFVQSTCIYNIHVHVSANYVNKIFFYKARHVYVLVVQSVGGSKALPPYNFHNVSGKKM